MKKVRKAVIPAAGLGTRYLSYNLLKIVNANLTIKPCHYWVPYAYFRNI